MFSLSFFGLAFYALVLIGAFAVRSAAGFGAVLVAVPMLAFILPMTTAVPVASALAVVTSIRYVSRDWRHIAWRQFAIISLYTIIGICVGFYFLRILDEHTLRRGLAFFLIIYSIYVLSTGGMPPALSSRWHSALAACAGILGGFFGALFGGGVGPIYVIYFNILRLERDAFRATMTTVMLVSAAARIVGYASFGFYAGSTLPLLALGLPLVAIGSWLGDRLAYILNPRRFSFFIGGLVMVSGVALLFK
ncbi:MAG TPA: sulfite exporter TauE/SafE family protein [Stellaceae bacterium]|nr:sulfite exporter TauE/SafE family protein [Stellaceae bacterium]